VLGAVAFAMLEFQSHLIFPVHAVAKPGPWPKAAEHLSATTPDGDTLRGIRIPPVVPDKSKTLVLGFGGNAWNGQDVAEYLHELYPGHEVVVFHYRGYPPSTGSPSAKAITTDALLVYDTAVAGLKPAKVIVVGFSIGTGVAAQLAGARQLDGLILVTPFDSLKAVAQSMYPWLPIAPFFAHEIDAAAPLRAHTLPVAIISAERDEIVPPDRTNALRKVVPDLVFDRTIPRAGHNDIYARSDFQEAMRTAFDLVRGRPG
jgi:hypothetical protein